MPTITNKKTGISYEVTEEEFAIIENSVLADEYSLATYNGVISREDLLLLLEDSKLVPYRFYTLEQVTSQEINLIVQAVSNSKLNEIAINVANGENYIYDVINDIINDSNINHIAIVNNYNEFILANENDNIKQIIISASQINLEDNTINIESNKSYIFQNTEIIHNSNNIIFINAVGKENFVISGKLNITGTRTTNQKNTTEKGIYIDNCSNYIIENIAIKSIRGYAIHLDSNSAPTIRGNKGKFNNINLDLNNYPIYINAGSGAEYNLFSNISATQNENPFNVLGGNNMFVNCNIVDNTKGVYLGSGANHAHGIFNGCNINHNTDYNLLIENVTLGQNFNGCHFYGDSIGGLGKIKIDSSKGININNGHIDAYIEVVNGANSGLNYISNNFIDGTYTSLNGDGLSKLVLKDNFTANAPSTLNTISSVYVEAKRSIAQSITSGDKLIYDDQIIDLLNCLDNTGIFTAPYSGLYEVNLNCVFTGSGIDVSNSFIEVLKNSATIQYLGLLMGGSIALANSTIIIRLSATDTLAFQTSFSGSGLAMDTVGSFIKIKRID